jgi:uncharacterized damage-inducible protein DinB
MASGTALAQRVRAQGESLLRLLSAMDDTAWRRRPAPEDWTVAESAGHIIEMLPYWSAKGEALRRDPATPYGRRLDDPDRLAGPGMAAALGLDEARKRVQEEVARAAAFLESLTEEELALPITDADGTPETLGIMVERVMATHLEGHVRQVADLR